MGRKGDKEKEGYPGDRKSGECDRRRKNLYRQESGSFDHVGGKSIGNQEVRQSGNEAGRGKSRDQRVGGGRI
jgi:hypothetical protein